MPIASIRWVSALWVALVVTSSLVTGPVAAGAQQPETCPNPGPEAVMVAITAPEPDATVSGVVTIEGTVESSAPVFRVELFVGDARKDVAFPDPPSTTASFTLVWDSGNRTPGRATIRVQACGGQPAEGSLVRGTAAVEVNVLAPASASPPGDSLLPAGDEVGVSRGPLWVGLLVGVSGLAGLAVASGSVPARSRPTRPRRGSLDPGHRGPEHPDSEDPHRGQQAPATLGVRPPHRLHRPRRGPGPRVAR